MKIIEDIEHDRLEDWHAWWVTGEIAKRDKNGQMRGRNVEYFKAVCNNPNCSAVGLINKDQLLSSVHTDLDIF